MSAGDKHGGDADGVGGDADGAMVTSSVSVSLKRDEEKGRKQVKEKFLEAVGITERSSSQPRRIIPRSGLAPTWPAWNFVLGGGGVAKNRKTKKQIQPRPWTRRRQTGHGGTAWRAPRAALVGFPAMAVTSRAK